MKKLRQTLLNLLKFQASTSDDKKIMEYLKQKCIKYKVEEDSFGNIYVTKGTSKLYPCMVSHTDTVHEIYKDFKIYEHNDIIFAFSNDVNSQVGIGGDDKCGVAACLQALEDFNNIKVVFFRFEETGCKGSEQANMKFFNNCSCVLQLDRKGNSGIVSNAAGVELCSVEFINKINVLLEKYNYKEINGSVTDVRKLKTKGLDVSCLNIECGYYNPHTLSEIINFYDFFNAYSLASEILKITSRERQLHQYVPVKYEKENKVSNIKNYKTIKTLFDFDEINEHSSSFDNKREYKNFTNDLETDFSYCEDGEINETLEDLDMAIDDVENIIVDYKHLRSKIKNKLGIL